MIQLTVPDQIGEKRFQLNVITMELEELKKAINTMPLSRMVTGGVPIGEHLALITSMDDRELVPKRVDKLTVCLFSTSRTPSILSDHRLGQVNILNFRVLYHLFNDGEGTCYRTTDADSHGARRDFPNLTVALDHAITELNEGLQQIADQLLGVSDKLLIVTRKLRKEL